MRWFETLGSTDVALVGGKNASLGEMIVAVMFAIDLVYYFAPNRPTR